MRNTRYLAAILLAACAPAVQSDTPAPQRYSTLYEALNAQHPELLRPRPGNRWIVDIQGERSSNPEVLRTVPLSQVRNFKLVHNDLSVRGRDATVLYVTLR